MVYTNARRHEFGAIRNEDDSGINDERVRFGRPDIPDLHSNGLFPVDMHFHTNHSDSPTRIKDLLGEAGRRGVGVAITDHNACSGVIEAYQSGSSAVVIPGIEISAADGPHILVYFYTPADLRDYFERHVKRRKRASPYLATTLSTGDILDSLDGYACMKVAAHPFGYVFFNKGLVKCINNAYLPGELVQRFDGLEVICGSMNRALNIQAANLASDLGMATTGGSDGHMLGDLGGVVTCTESEDAAGIIEQIMHRDNLVMGSEKHILGKCVMGPVVLMKYVRYTAPSLRIHYEQNAPRVRRFLGIRGKKGDKR